MSISKERRQQLVQEFGTKPGDTGSTAVQIALLTERLNELTEHFKTHSKDHHSRRGLLRIVSQRKRLLNYLQRKDLEQFRAIKKKLTIR